MKSPAFAIAAAFVLSAGGAQAATQLSCSNGAVSDTARVSINGTNATVTRESGRLTGKVDESLAFYQIKLGGKDFLSINRDSGEALLSVGDELIRFRCRLGGARL